MYENITLSEGLERIDYSLERIRNATGTQGQTVEDVAYAVELGYDMLNDKNVYVRNNYPDYVTGTLTSVRLNKGGVHIEGAVTRLHENVKQVLVCCLPAQDGGYCYESNTDGLTEGQIIDFERLGIEVGDSTYIGLHPFSGPLYILNGIDHFVLMVVVCNYDGTLAEPMAYNYITPDENNHYNIGYIQHYRDGYDDEKVCCYLPYMPKLNKTARAEVIPDPNYDITTQYQHPSEGEMKYIRYWDVDPNGEEPGVELRLGFYPTDYMDWYGFCEINGVPFEGENRNEVSMSIQGPLVQDWGTNGRIGLADIGPSIGESSGSLTDVYKSYFELTNHTSDTNYDYTVIAVYDDNSTTEVGSGIISPAETVGLGYTTSDIEIAANLTKYVITTTISEIQPEPEPDEGESI